jgi:hypothetical protein
VVLVDTSVVGRSVAFGDSRCRAVGAMHPADRSPRTPAIVSVDHDEAALGVPSVRHLSRTRRPVINAPPTRSGDDRPSLRRGSRLDAWKARVEGPGGEATPVSASNRRRKPLSPRWLAY